MPVTRDEVVWAYRILLGREPEREGVIEGKMGAGSVAELRGMIMASAEFRNQNTEAFPLVGRFLEVASNDVDLAATPAQRAAMLDNIRREWRRFGESEPHWSVLTGEEFRPERIGETIEQFYRTGRDHLVTMLNPIRRAGLPAERFGRVLDFGCGVGRLTLALAPLAGEAVGVDISPAHLRLAGERARETGVGNARFEAIDDVADLDRYRDGFDLVVSFIVLQHNPPPIMAVLLEKLLAALAPRGVLLVQLPTYIAGQRFAAADYLAHAQPAMEMNGLPQHDVFRIIREAGAHVLEVRQDTFLTGGGGLSHTLAIRRPPADNWWRRRLAGRKKAQHKAG